MKKFSGYKPEKSAGGREILPVGGYVAKILDAKEINYDWGDVLLISFDIIEGEYKDFFKVDYANQTREDKKWRGTFRLVQPKDDGSERDDWTKRTFNNAMFCIEDSNPNYTWEWDEKTLKGKIVGVLFRNREWEMDTEQGYKTGWTTECCTFVTVDDVRDNKFKMPKDKPLKNKSSNSAGGFIPIDDDSDLPF